MLPEENNLNEQPDDEYVEIYSKRAIWGFSIFFSPLFGGVLLMLNLRAAGYKAAANIVLIFSVGYMVLSAVLMKVLQMYIKVTLVNLAVFTIILNITGGAILTQYFFKKYFPDDDYYPKSITVPLIASVVITLALQYLLVGFSKYAGI